MAEASCLPALDREEYASQVCHLLDVGIWAPITYGKRKGRLSGLFPL